MRILGIDPGTGRTGYGVLDEKKHVAHGCIETDKEKAAEQRLYDIERELLKLVTEYKPDIMAIEMLFFFKNSKTVIPVAEARGVALLVAAKKNLPVYNFSPLQVKMTITGYGRADKKQIQKMIAQTLSLPEVPKPDDAADALGIALTCSFFLKTNYPHSIPKRG